MKRFLAIIAPFARLLNPSQDVEAADISAQMGSLALVLETERVALDVGVMNEHVFSGGEETQIRSVEGQARMNLPMGFNTSVSVGHNLTEGMPGNTIRAGVGWGTQFAEGEHTVGEVGASVNLIERRGGTIGGVNRGIEIGASIGARNASDNAVIFNPMVTASVELTDGTPRINFGFGNRIGLRIRSPRNNAQEEIETTE